MFRRRCRRLMKETRGEGVSPQVKDGRLWDLLREAVGKREEVKSTG